MSAQATHGAQDDLAVYFNSDDANASDVEWWQLRALILMRRALGSALSVEAYAGLWAVLVKHGREQR